LPGYDYSSAGAYFVTICVNNRLSLLGEIREGVMDQSVAGLMGESWRCSIPMKFPTVVVDSYVVMPNHVHGIVVLNPGDVEDEQGKHGGLPLQKAVISPTLARVVQWFKPITTTDHVLGVRKYDFQPFDRRLWQKNYYEHIVRNDGDMARIRHYIATNVTNWHLDRENPNV
jgi:REP element-mobilizing transposase RayT